MKKLRVIIEGEIGAGKTVLAALLNAHLADLGMRVTVRGENPIALRVVKDIARVKEGISLGAFQPRDVTLEVAEGTDPAEA